VGWLLSPGNTSSVAIPRNLLHVEDCLDIPLFNAASWSPGTSASSDIRLLGTFRNTLGARRAHRERRNPCFSHARRQGRDCRVLVLVNFRLQISAAISPPCCFNFHLVGGFKHFLFSISYITKGSSSGATLSFALRSKGEGGQPRYLIIQEIASHFNTPPSTPPTHPKSRLKTL